MTPRPAPTVQGLTINDIRSVVEGAIDQKLADLHRSVGDTAVRAAAQAFVAARLAGVQGMLHAVAALLAIRALLFLHVAACFVLAIMTMRNGSYQSAALFVAFSFLIFPLVWLVTRKQTGA